MTFDPSGPAVHDGVYGLPHTPEEAALVLIPVPWEPTTSYLRGTAKGPAAMREASKQVELFDRALVDTPLRGRPYERGLAMLPEDPEITAWNAEATQAADLVIDAATRGLEAPREALARVNERSAALDARVHAIASAWLAKGKRVGTLGGDHSSPFGAIRAHVERFPELGVLHVDAHADLRVAYEGFEGSHASILHNVMARLPVRRLVQVGLRDVCEEEVEAIARSDGRIRAFFDADVRARLFDGEPWAKVADEIVGALPGDVYVTFDIDGLEPALCPHTGTPVPGGLTWREATDLLDRIRRSGRRVVGFDVTEVAPGPDGDEWDANVGARLVYRLAGLALC